MRRLLARLDELSALIERVVVLTLLVLMAAVVFFDVVHRVASSPQGLVLSLLVAASGGAPSEATLETLRSTGVPAVCALLTFGFYFAALRTTSRTARSAGLSALIAFGATAATGLALYALLTIFPNGLVWSQPLALAMLLWVALLGATLVTRARGHIAFEVADRIWPKAMLPWARLISGLVAAAFCLVVTVLAVHYVSDFYEQWRLDGVGYISGVPLPKWVAYLAIPACFALMGVRFLGYAIRDFFWGPNAERDLAAEVES